ncbi:CLUMA_CG015049, isoform A [Clunio marinus]|uniref:MICOS complex subunit n=1 Tax=Clunio marinus TaxID=568069 RepID=A0A1J1IQ74_9DIPT|nr:CLUMA_CG015049, isoform A [Clunio marinus]
MLRRLIAPGGSMVAAAGVIVKNEESADGKKEKSFICRPSDLPIYTPHVESKPKAEHKPSKIAQTIEEGVSVVRKEVTKVTDVYENQKANLDRYYVKALKDTQHIRNYLQEEDNTLPRVGAIAVGSLAGVVFGIRGGFFKRLFYATVSGSAVAVVCYPREAKKYATVAYNFAYGIKPGDERQKTLPKFPTSFGEVKDNVVDLSSKAYNAAFGSQK